MPTFKPSSCLSLLFECCRFCWPCITQWSEQETRCPLCKQRFQTIKRKAVYFGDPHTTKRRKLNPPATAAADDSGPSTPGESSAQLLAFAAAAAEAGDAAADTETAAAGAGTAADAVDAATAAAEAGDASDGSSCPQSPKGRLEGVVLETKRVKQRDQARHLRSEFRVTVRMCSHMLILVCTLMCWG